MREWAGQDPTEVRAADLASATAVVVRFRRKRRATVAAALCVGVATLVSSRAFFAVTTTSLVPTEQPPATAPAVGVSPAPSPTGTPPDPAGGPRPGATPASGRGTTGGTGVVVPGTDPDEPPDGVRRNRRFRIGMVRELGGSMSTTQCGINPLPSQAQVCVSPTASQQKNGSVVLRYTACLRQPTLATAAVRFPTTREVDFAIVKDGRIVWQWSTGQRFVAQDHFVTIPANDCVTWRTRWTGYLDDGTRLPPGKYTLRASGKDTTKLLPRRLVTFDVKT